MVFDDYSFYLITGQNYMNKTDNSIWTELNIANCKGGLWTVSLTFDQTAIGGNEIRIWSQNIIQI